MFLTEEKIKEKAIEIYQESLKNPRISEDHCTEIYERFIKRMKSLKYRKPHIKEVSPAIITKAVHFICRELKKRDRIQEDREEVQSLIRQALYDDLENRENSEARQDILYKITSFIRRSAEKKKNYVQYTHLFLLYYSYYLPLNYIVSLEKSLGLPVTMLEEQIRVVREKAIERSTRKIQMIEKELYKTYTKILESHHMMKQGVDKKERRELYEKSRPLHFKQKSALIKKRSIEIVPSITQLASLTKQGNKRIIYALKVFCEGLRQNGIKRKAIRKSA